MLTAIELSIYKPVQTGTASWGKLATYESNALLTGLESVPGPAGLADHH